MPDISNLHLIPVYQWPTLFLENPPGLWSLSRATHAIDAGSHYLKPLALQTVGLDQAFWPLYEVEEVAEDWWWGSGMPLRLAMAATSVALVWGLATVSPGKGTAQHPLHGGLLWLRNDLDC